MGIEEPNFYRDITTPNRKAPLWRGACRRPIGFAHADLWSGSGILPLWLRGCQPGVVRTACGRDVRVPRVGAVPSAAARQEPGPTDVALVQEVVLESYGYDEKLLSGSIPPDMLRAGLNIASEGFKGACGLNRPKGAR